MRATWKPRPDEQSVSVAVGQKPKISSTLDGSRELALVTCVRPSNSARNDLTRLCDVTLKGIEILVIDLLNAFYRELAVASATKITCHRKTSRGLENRIAH
jgi:hypothetical protein